jgi:hypothetical protein
MLPLSSRYDHRRMNLFREGLFPLGITRKTEEAIRTAQDVESTASDFRNVVDENRPVNLR